MELLHFDALCFESFWRSTQLQTFPPSLSSTYPIVSRVSKGIFLAPDEMNYLTDMFSCGKEASGPPQCLRLSRAPCWEVSYRKPQGSVLI